MRKKLIIGASIGVAVLAIILTSSNLIDQNLARPESGLGFTYEYANSQLQTTMLSQGISMSSPLKISGDSIGKYCKFFEDESKQNLIKYCTSTELRSSAGKFLGNIHVVGSTNSPELIIGIIQADPFMSQYDDIKKVFSSVISELVCDCWNEYRPDGFTTSASWIDAMKDFHMSSGKTTTKSKLVPLDGK